MKFDMPSKTWLYFGGSGKSYSESTFKLRPAVSQYIDIYAGKTECFE